MRPLFLFLLLASLATAQTPQYDITPRPVQLTPQTGFFTFSAQTVLVKTAGYRSFLHRYLAEKQQLQLPQQRRLKKAPAAVVYTRAAAGQMGPEAYEIAVSPGRVVVTAAGDAGFFYADQTLIQLLERNGGRQLPCCRIQDAPRFSWRGMHLDESRHFFGKTFVKQYLDYLAALKMNVFHWHLTDAPGWRLDIKKYPKLTSLAAWRPDRSGVLFGDADTARTGEPLTYGGFYTRADVREILAWARERHITVVPEIEMPGHTTAALVAYPEFSCTGGPFPMPGGAKNCPYPNFCVGNEATFTFLQNVLTEVIRMFPSTYIHIGGDEVERQQWKHCPGCQKRMADLGLSDEAQLQVYFTKRIEDFLRSKGRRLLGWDEIMEGGNLTPSAGVMVWRGEKLAREATAAGHDAVITHNYYFDLYQGNPQYEPVTYGYLPLPQVYHYEPVPADLPAAQQSHILGVQGCLWTENVYDTQHAEYMLFPRLLALAEVAWTPAARRAWVDFQRRLPADLDWLRGRGIHFATTVFDPEPTVRFDSLRNMLVCAMEQQIPFGTIRYTLDGSAPTTASPPYYQPVALTKAAEIRTAAFSNDRVVSKTTAVSYRPSLASGRPFVLRFPPAAPYNAVRPEALTDGLRGSNAFRDGQWCGFYGDDFDLTIDLGKVEALDSIRLNFFEANGSWIYLPLALEVALSSDGTRFEPLYSANSTALSALSTGRIKSVRIPAGGRTARYVRLLAKNPGAHPVYPDGKCWLFVDEVEIK